MLGGTQVKREDQRDNCPKHETTWDDSCHSEFEGVQIKYLFMQYMDGFNYGPKTGRRGKWVYMCVYVCIWVYVYVFMCVCMCV